MATFSRGQSNGPRWLVLRRQRSVQYQYFQIPQRSLKHLGTFPVTFGRLVRSIRKSLERFTNSGHDKTEISTIWQVGRYRWGEHTWRDKASFQWPFCREGLRFYIHQNSYLAPRLGGIEHKKCIIHCWASRWFLLFYSPKPRSPVWILIYQNWFVETRFSL